MKNQWKKVATEVDFLLYQSVANPKAWQVRLRASGNFLRRRFAAATLDAALAEAPAVAGLTPPEADAHAIVDAFNECLAGTNRGERARRDWVVACKAFIEWLAKNRPLCTTWESLTRKILREYLATYDGRSANFRRLAVQPVIQTAGYMHREYGTVNFAEKLGIGSKLAKTPPTVYLEDVVTFCDHLAEHAPHLEAGAALQGLAGLQMLEAMRLTWDKVDLRSGLIEISGEVKNSYRVRVIPVCKRVVEALRRNRLLIDSEKVISIGASHIIRGRRGEPFRDATAYSRQIRKRLLRWNDGIEWAPKDMRNALPTFAAMEGVISPLWEQYIGHAPRTVTARHYVPRLASPSEGEAIALSKAMDAMRRAVVEPIDRKTCNKIATVAGRPTDELQVDES